MIASATASGLRPVIEIAGVTKIYEMGSNKVAALRGIDLVVMPGELIGRASCRERV